MIPPHIIDEVYHTIRQLQHNRNEMNIFVEYSDYSQYKYSFRSDGHSNWRINKGAIIPHNDLTKVLHNILPRYFIRKISFFYNNGNKKILYDPKWEFLTKERIINVPNVLAQPVFLNSPDFNKVLTPRSNKMYINPAPYLVDIVIFNVIPDILRTQPNSFITYTSIETTNFLNFKYKLVHNKITHANSSTFFSNSASIVSFVAISARIPDDEKIDYTDLYKKLTNYSNRISVPIKIVHHPNRKYTTVDFEIPRITHPMDEILPHDIGNIIREYADDDIWADLRKFYAKLYKKNQARTRAVSEPRVGKLSTPSSTRKSPPTGNRSDPTGIRPRPPGEKKKSDRATITHLITQHKNNKQRQEDHDRLKAGSAARAAEADAASQQLKLYIKQLRSDRVARDADSARKLK